ncbi:hypothetical protein Cob_v002468 [Colletotrichum orbiculare MAFF 240422]|uniref:Uncharacterized protein n=1 Tax=Colletotrichum orbiculare (strain 104-T / ATCC 96160 / CBS 514.97 / LARS 414 / MAFF 240422) TaxID=1213857 RepID=A0A484G4U2_COLOR|nr:hypothetical protein Cob_v002468 [Colletotrichum orbiculare MAFF 240422]
MVTPPTLLTPASPPARPLYGALAVGVDYRPRVAVAGGHGRPSNISGIWTSRPESSHFASSPVSTTLVRQRQRPQRPSSPFGGHESRWGAR